MTASVTMERNGRGRHPKFRSRSDLTLRSRRRGRAHAPSPRGRKALRINESVTGRTGLEGTDRNSKSNAWANYSDRLLSIMGILLT